MKIHTVRIQYNNSPDVVKTSYLTLFFRDNVKNNINWNEIQRWTRA